MKQSAGWFSKPCSQTPVRLSTSDEPRTVPSDAPGLSGVVLIPVSGSDNTAIVLLGGAWGRRFLSLPLAAGRRGTATARGADSVPGAGLASSAHRLSGPEPKSEVGGTAFVRQV